MIDNLFSSTLEGFILHDTSFSQAVRQQKALLDIYPSSVAVLGFRTLAQQLLATPEAAYPKGGIQFFGNSSWHDRNPMRRNTLGANRLVAHGSGNEGEQQP